MKKAEAQCSQLNRQLEQQHRKSEETTTKLSAKISVYEDSLEHLQKIGAIDKDLRPTKQMKIIL